jgi:hypothetical protein
MNESETSIAGEALSEPAAAARAQASRPARRPLSRWRAAGIHLTICAGIAAAVLALMLGVWYPPPLFEAMGGSGLVLILVGVDMVLGPMLTLVVFRSGKRGLKLDLAVIAAFQLSALLYGCHIVALARPAFIVFVKDQFQVSTVAELRAERLAEARYPQYRHAPWSGPALVYGDWPKDPADRQRLIDAIFTGEDLQHFPKYFAPYAEGRGEILAKAEPVSRVRRIEPEAAKAIDAWLERSGVDEQSVLYLRLRARNGWVAVLIDRVTAEPVKMLLAEKY